ncbi:hypothetical protein ACJJTC_002359 [Scirpophaga incertulas]
MSRPKKPPASSLQDELTGTPQTPRTPTTIAREGYEGGREQMTQPMTPFKLPEEFLTPSPRPSRETTPSSTPGTSRRGSPAATPARANLAPLKIPSVAPPATTPWQATQGPPTTEATGAITTKATYSTALSERDPRVRTKRFIEKTQPVAPLAESPGTTRTFSPSHSRQTSPAFPKRQAAKRPQSEDDEAENIREATRPRTGATETTAQEERQEDSAFHHSAYYRYSCHNRNRNTSGCRSTSCPNARGARTTEGPKEDSQESESI